jgi:hypothetical protein
MCRDILIRIPNVGLRKREGGSSAKNVISFSPFHILHPTTYPVVEEEESDFVIKEKTSNSQSFSG